MKMDVVVVSNTMKGWFLLLCEVFFLGIRVVIEISRSSMGLKNQMLFHA
uniref:Uncharacterized protein n=1 Tax=Arundo donax TaxID=35708 RepID=A0A0A9AQY8_ARUDO